MRKSLRLSPCAGVLIICWMMLLVTGCPQKPLPPPVLPGAEMAEMTTAEVSQIITKRAEQFRNLKGTGKVRIQTWEERYRFSEAFVLETPARFRLETLGFFDQPVIFLTSNEEILALYTKKHNVSYRGVASQENLFKLSGINLTVEDVIQVLSGNPPLLSQIDSEWGMFLTDLKKYYLERVSLRDNIVQRIWFDTTTRTISNIQGYKLTNGELLLDLQFKDYRAEAGTYPIPAYILIDRPLDKTRVEIVYKYFAVNQQLDQTVFTFIPPEDAKVRFIDDVTAAQIERLAPYEEFRVKE